MVDASVGERIAAQKPPYGQEGSFEGAVDSDGVVPILGTTRIVPACWWGIPGYSQLVAANEQHQRFTGQCHQRADHG